MKSRPTRSPAQAVRAALLSLAGALVLATAALARPVPEPIVRDAPDDAPTAHVAQSSLSLQQATSIAVGRFQGRVVRAETVARDGRRIHEIRILGDDGRVRTVRIDAQTGQFL